MPYPLHRPVKLLFYGLSFVVLTIGAKAAPTPKNFGDCARFSPHISSDFALYKRDTTLEQRHSGIVRHERNGDLVMAVPSGSPGHYKVRFFDGSNALLFEVREITESP